MDVLLRAPLPKPKCTRTLGPILDGGPPQSTHPTIVMEWPGWEAEVKANLKRPKVKNLSDNLPPIKSIIKWRVHDIMSHLFARIPWCMICVPEHAGDLQICPRSCQAMRMAVQTFRPNYYQRTDEALAITDENDAASLLLATACQRINSVYAIDGDQCSFSIHPSKRPFEVR